MSPRRTSKEAGWVNPSKLTKGPNGRALCRECGTEVPKGRRTFCSDQCVDEWKVKTDPGHVSALVLKRDNGICALCGRDTMEALRSHDASRTDWRAMGYDAYQGAAYRWKRKRAEIMRESGWHADHIVPVCEGAGVSDSTWDSLALTETAIDKVKSAMAWLGTLREAKRLYEIGEGKRATRWGG